MNVVNFRSVRARLWAALALLSLAVLAASFTTWIALQRVDARLQDLHQETLSQVAQALDLSKRSADLATSAPYLMNQRSNFSIEQEGTKLLVVLERVRADWPQTRFGESNPNGETVFPILDKMAAGVTDLISASSALDRLQAELRGRTATLGKLRSLVSSRIASEEEEEATRLTWWSLQSMNADALNAAYAGNLIGVGEEQRQYLQQRNLLNTRPLNDDQRAFLSTLEQSVWGPSGILELRRLELSKNLDAQNALFRIRHDANRINDLASTYAQQAEAFLAQERNASSSTIRVASISVAAISALSLALALTAAIYVSRYVTFNISRVSAAMVRLANGDRASALPRRLGGKDEIGDLFRSFRSFRANALRLDRSNRQLDQRNALFEKVFTNISDGIAITDPAGHVTASNQAFEKILRVPQNGRRPESLVGWLLDSSFGNSTRENGLRPDHRGFCQLVSDDGQILEIRASKLPDDGRVWLLADVTERQKMSDRLQQIDRIESLGKVAGDTAHDFANILSSIRTHAHLLEAHSGDDGAASLAAIANAVDFGSSMTDRLLAFARKQSLAPERVDLNALIGGMTDLVEISLTPKVDLIVSLPDDPLYVIADPGQLESALFNLLLNANNAILDSGCINVTLTATEEAQARIWIEDDGQGMSNEVLDRAIEPFFTTRGDEGGTGLGLSIVYGFIRQTGGAMSIESSVGQGTQVEVLLPLEGPALPKVARALTQKSLVVEDDPKTREVGKGFLEALGFEVLTCATSTEALSTLRGQQFDLLLSDLDLGSDIDGLAIIEVARRASDVTKTILMSGKTAKQGRVPGHTVFIEKPLTAEKLAHAIEVISRISD